MIFCTAWAEIYTTNENRRYGVDMTVIVSFFYLADAILYTTMC